MIRFAFTYTHDANRQLTKVENSDSETTTFTFDDAGRKAQSEQDNGTVAQMGYDNADRLNAVVNLNSSSVTLSSFFYGLDGAGNRTSILGEDGTIISNWSYDSLNQIGADYYLPPVTSLSWSLLRAVLMS